MAFEVDWPITAGDTESITFVWPGTLGDETYTAQVRAYASRSDDGTDPLATCTVAAEQVSSNIEVTIELTAAQTRTLGGFGPRAAYDLQQTNGAAPSTLFKGQVIIDGDVTK